MDSDEAAARSRARDLRMALASYVAEVHAAYADAARRAGVEPTALGLGGDGLTVAIVAADELHVIATHDELPPLRPHEEPVRGEVAGLRWNVRFLDASVLDALLLPEAGGDPRALLGVDTVQYHLRVGIDGALSGHQATHAGAGLAHAHLRGVRA